MLKDACEQVHLEYSSTRLETQASNGRGENSVRIMKEMVQRQKGAVVSLGIEFSAKHPIFALLVRHNEWILSHVVRNDFVVELDNRVIKTSPYESHTENPAPRSTSLLNRILVGRRDDDDKQPRVQQAWYLGLIAGSDEVIALHPDGVQRHHGEWRVSPMDDPESNLRELKSALALMTEVDWRTPGCKTCQDVRYHKGWHSVECRERALPTTVPDTMWPVAITKRLLDTGADDARDDHESKRRKSSDDTVPMAQEHSSGSGVKRSNLEVIRRADAEAEKALKRAKVLEERRAAKRASATPMDELEESATNAEVSAAAEAVLTETRETIEAPTVSALRQAHEMSHRPETTAQKFLPSSQGHDSDVQRASSSETARFLGEHESLRRGVRGRVAYWDTRHVRPLGRHDENYNIVEIQVHCERLRRTSQRWRWLCSYSNNTGHPYAPGKMSRQTRSGTRSFCGRLHASLPQR